MGCGNSKVDESRPIDLNSKTLDDNISAISKSIVKVDYPDAICFGFLIKFFKEDKDFFCLLIPENKITQDIIERKESIKFFYDNESKIKKINLDPKKRYIKNFKDIGIKVIIVEILSSDEIGKEFFLLPMINYVDKFNELKNEEIITIHFPKGKFVYFPGKINEINKYEFSYSIKTKMNSLGLPIFLKGNTKVIGIQKEENKADFIGPIFNFLKNLQEEENTKINLATSQIKDQKTKYETINYSNEANYKNGKKEGNGEIKYENGNYYKGEEKMEKEKERV